MRSDSEKESRAAAAPSGRRRLWRGLPPDIWALGFGSLFMDCSSEAIHSVLPLFLVNVLGASLVTVGFIEGVAEATAAILKVFSGTLSDYLGRRKRLVVAGYGLSALTKPVFALAGSIGWVFGARFADRVGKGIRGAPRDALIADITPAPLRGAAYGLRQALDSVGAVLGPLLALLLLVRLAEKMRAVMWIAAIPAIVAVALLSFYVHEPEGERAPPRARAPLSRADIRQLPVRYWMVTLLGALFTLARFSEAFLILRAKDVGLGLRHAPIVMVVMNVFYAGFAYPAGAAADRLRSSTLLLIGLALLVAADVALALAGGAPAVIVGATLWGLHMALTQGLLSKLVADTVPAALRGTGFGLFNLVNGVALFLASVIAGGLWRWIGPAATFWAGGAFALAAALGLAIFRPASR